MKKVKKIIGWTVFVCIIVGILSVPIIAMGWGEGLIIWAIVFALSGIMYWAMGAMTED